MTNHELTCDVLVAGGGAAGVPCALAAARQGARVILCQDRAVLGGNASSEVRMHIVGANGTGRFDRGQELETEARESGIIEEIRLETSIRNPQRSASMLDLILYEKCRAEPALTLMLNTTVVAAESSGNRIMRVIAERQSTEDRFLITASVYVDCTGDGRLGAEAGATFREGREGRDEYSESLAPESADNARLGSTILMQARRHERAMPFVAPPWARQFRREDLKLRLYATPGEEEPTHEYGYWWAEWGGTLDTIKDNELIRDELLSIVLGIWDHVKNGPPDEELEDPFRAANWALDWFGFLPGKRESRRFLGQHVLTQQDVQTSRRFADAIAFGGWSLDLHTPLGVDAADEPPCEQHIVPYLYDIPLRCCISRNIDNLMFAGRNISATHVAFSSTRVMATCAVIGQGVGTAAAYAVSQEISPCQLAQNEHTLHAIQQQLLRDDAFLIDHRNCDRKDLARCARISATSEQPGSEAVNVISGLTRSVHGERGVPPERAIRGTQRWMSKPEDGFPISLQLEWETPVQLHELQLVFDTGLHRHLTLSHHDGYTSKMFWGRPQPETICDFAIERRVAGEWISVVRIRDNYQRLFRYRFETPLVTDAIRIHVESTHGADHARLFEVRAY